MGNAQVKDFLAGKEESEMYLKHFMHPEVLNHSKYLAEKWLSFNITKNKEYQEFFDWSNVQITPNIQQVRENIALQEKKETLLVGMFPKKNAPELTNPSFFDEIQVSFNPSEVTQFRDRQNQKFLILYQIYYLMQNVRRQEQGIVKTLKDMSAKDQIPKAAEIGIRSGVHLIIGLLREAAEHNPKLKEETLNFLLELFAEVKPLSLWGTNKVDAVLDKSLHTVSEYLEEQILADKTSAESKSKALKVLFSLGLLRGSLSDLLSVIELVSKLHLDVDLARELKLLQREKADLSFDFEKRYKASTKSFFTSAVKEAKPANLEDKSPYASVTTDGKYLYIHSEVEGLLKIGTGFKYTMLGKVYIHKPEYRLKERASLAYILGKLYYRSAKIAPAPIIEIDPNTLEEKSSAIHFDNLAPNCMYPEMTNPEIELPHTQTNQADGKDEKRGGQKGTSTTTRLPSSLKRDIRLLRPSQRSPAFTEGRYLYMISQWTVDVQRRGTDSDDEDEGEHAETKQARYGVDIYDPLKDFEHIRCVELSDPKSAEGRITQKFKLPPPLNAKILDEASFTTNGSQLVVGVPYGVEGERKYKYFDLESGELVKTSDIRDGVAIAQSKSTAVFGAPPELVVSHSDTTLCYDSYNNIMWSLNDTKRTFNMISAFRNNSLPPKFIYPEDSEFYTPYENDQIIQLASEDAGLEEGHETKKSQREEKKQENIQTLLSLGFHVSSKKLKARMLQLKSSSSAQVPTKGTELFILANIARLAESYATLEYSSSSAEDLIGSIRRPYSVQLTDKVFDSLLNFLEGYGKAFFEMRSAELDDESLYEQCSFLCCLRILKYNLAALENFTETLEDADLRIVEDDFAPRLKYLVWKIIDSTPYDNKEAEGLRLAIYNEALSIISNNLSLMYPDFRDILKLLKNYINKIDDTKNKDIVKSILFWLKSKEHIIQLVSLIVESSNSAALIDEIKALTDTILTWETNSFSYFLRSAEHPKELSKYTTDAFLDVSLSFVIELQKELIFQLGHKLQEKHLEMAPHHVLLFKLNESICKTAIVMNSEIQDYMTRANKIVEEEVRQKDREQQEEEKSKEAKTGRKESPAKKKKEDPLWKKIQNATRDLWDSICDTYTSKVYFSYILSFQINSLNLLSSHFLVASKTLKHISTFLVSLNNLYSVRSSLEKAVAEKTSTNVVEKVEVVESEHPYASKLHKIEKIHIPGAKKLSITFDPQCNLRKGADFLQFSADDKGQKILSERLGGMVDFPKDPLVIDGDTVYYVVHTSNNNQSLWGYKFNVTGFIEDQVQSDWMVDLHRSACWLAGKCAAQLISGTYLQQALLGDEEQKYNNLLNSKLFSGGMEKCYFGSGKEGVWIELSETMNEFQTGHLIEYLSSDMTETERKEEEFLNHLIDGHSSEDVEKLLDFLQKQFSKGFVWSNLGGENATKCVRAAFAVIVKHGGLVHDIREAIKEIETEDVKKGKLTSNLKNLLKKWQAASRMRTWLVEKKKDIDDSIEKSKYLSERKPAAPVQKPAAQQQAAPALFGEKKRKKSKHLNDSIKIEAAPVPVVEKREEAPKAEAPLQMRDSGEIIEKMIDQIVKKAQFLCQLIPAKHWSTDKTEQRDKHLLFRSSSQMESENKEEEWKRRLQQWKSVRESKQVYKSLEDETQEIHLSLTTSVLLCLQSSVSIKRLRKQVECAYLRAICRTIGLNALTSILVGAPSSLFKQDLVGWLCSSLRGTENKLYHFTDNLQGCGHFLESTVNSAFKKLLVAIVRSMANSNDPDEIKSMLEALKWKYHGDDHIFLAEIDLFGLLRGGPEHKLLRNTWGKSIESTKDTKSDSVMVKKLLNLFETMVILCIGKLNWKRDELALPQLGGGKKDQPALETHMSYIDEASIDILLKQAFAVTFGELEEAYKNYKDFKGIDWAAYARALKRKELQSEKKKKTKKKQDPNAPAAFGGTTAFGGGGFGSGFGGFGGGGGLFGASTTGGLFGAQPAPAFGATAAHDSDSDNEYDDYGNRRGRRGGEESDNENDGGSVDMELERQLRGGDFEDETEEQNEPKEEREEEKEEEKSPDEPEEEEKDDKDKPKKKAKKSAIKALIQKEERLLKEMNEKLYNPEFLYRLLMLLYKCVSTGSDHIWAAVGNPKYVSILLNLLTFGPPPHQVLVLKTLTALLENLPVELFVDSILEYNEKNATKLEKGEKKEEMVLLDFFGNMLSNKRKNIFVETLEYPGQFVVTSEIVGLFRSLLSISGWSGSVREWLRASLEQQSELKKQLVIDVLGGDITGLRYGGRAIIHSSDADDIFENNILLKEKEEERSEEATIVGFAEDYKEKKSDVEKKKENTKAKKENEHIYMNLGSIKQRNNPIVLLDSSLNKDSTNFSSIELTAAVRYNTVGVDSSPFLVETFPLKQNKDVLLDFFGWATNPEEIGSLSSEGLHLKATSVKALSQYLSSQENVAYLLKEHKDLVHKLIRLSKMQIISGNPLTLEVTEERLHRLLAHACEGGISLGNPQDLTATVKTKELVVLLGREFTMIKYNVVSGFNLDKIKGFYNLEPLSSKITPKNASTKAILVEPADLEKKEYRDVLFNAAFIVTANYDLQKFAEHYESQQKGKGKKGGKDAGGEESSIAESYETKEKHTKYPKCIVNISDKAFANILREHETQKLKAYRDVFVCKKLVDELVEFGFPRETCEKYFEQNYGNSVDVAVSEISKILEQEEEQRKKNEGKGDDEEDAEAKAKAAAEEESKQQAATGFGGFGTAPAGGFGGFGAPVAGGFGTAGGFGAQAGSRPAGARPAVRAAPAGGFGGFGAAPAGGFGGFGAPATGVFGAGGFGAAAPFGGATTFGGATAFGGAATTSFGGATAFGGATGFGGQPMGGFGAPASGLFGQPAEAKGAKEGGLFGAAQGAENEEEEKKEGEEEEDEEIDEEKRLQKEMEKKKQKHAVKSGAPGQPLEKKEQPVEFGAKGTGSVRSPVGFEGAKAEEDGKKKSKGSPKKKTTAGDQEEEKSEEEENEESDGEDIIEEEEKEVDKGDKKNVVFDIEKEDPNPCFKCQNEKDVSNAIEERNKLYDDLIDFEDTNHIGKLIVFKHLNYNLLVYYARRAVLNLLEKWPQEVENELLAEEKNQDEFLDLIKRLSVEGIFSSCSFGNYGLLNRIKRLLSMIFSSREKGVTSLVEKLYSEHIEGALKSLDKISNTANPESKDGKTTFNTRLPSEIDIQYPCLDYSLWMLQNMLTSSTQQIKSRALSLDIMYTLFGLIPAIKNNKHLLWGTLVFSLKLVNAIREDLSILKAEDKDILTHEKVKNLCEYFFALKNKEKFDSLSKRTQLLSELIINLNRLQKEASAHLKVTDLEKDNQLDLNKFKTVDNLTDIVELMENYQNSKILLASSWLQANNNILTKEQKVIESDHFYQKNLHTYKVSLEHSSGLNIKFSEESFTDEGDSIVLSSDPEGKLSVQKFGGDLFRKNISFPSGSCYVHFPVKGGDISVFGSNDQNQYSPNPQVSGITTLETYSKYNTVMIDGGDQHSAILTTDGELFTCGSGHQVGSGLFGSTLSKSFSKVFIKDKVKTFSCGSNFTIFATEANEVYGVGNNAEGRCGLNWNSSSALPQIIDLGGPKVVKLISCGNNHSLIYTEDKFVYGTGGNECGQLGIVDDFGNTQHGIQSFRVINDLSKKNVVGLVAGTRFSLALVQEGGKTHLMQSGDNMTTKFAFGNTSTNMNKQFTRLDALDGAGVTYIHGKNRHCVAVTKRGEIYSWGMNDNGQLGHGTTEALVKPKKIAFFKDKKVVSAITLANTTLVIAESGADKENKVYLMGENIVLKGKDKKKDHIKTPIVIDYFNDKSPVKLYGGANHAFAVNKPMDIPIYRDTHKMKCEATQEPIKGPMFVDILKQHKAYSLQGVEDPKHKDQLSGILLVFKEAIHSSKDFQWPDLETTDENEYLEKATGNVIFEGKTCSGCQKSPITDYLYVSLHEQESESHRYLCQNCAFKILDDNVMPSLYFRVSRPLKKTLPSFPRSQFYPSSETYGYVMTLTPSYNEKGYNYLIDKYQEAYDLFASDMKNLKPEIDEQVVDLLNNMAQKQEKTVFDLNENITFAREELSVRTAIEKCSTEFLRKRFLVLKQFNQKFKNILPFIDFSAKKDTQRLRNIYSKCSVYIFWDVKSELFEKILVGGGLFGGGLHAQPHNTSTKVKVNRMRASKFIQRGKPDHTGEFTVFGQIFQSFKNIGYSSFKVNKDVQPFSVQFVGEAAIDVGGPYREAISQICTELQSGALPLLIPSPNQKNDSGQFREKWVLNPSANSIVHFKMFEFLGVLMGTSIRTKNFLNLDLPSFVWKQLVDVPLNRKDLENIDRYLIQCLDDIINIHKKGIDEVQFMEIIQEKFVTTLSDGREVDLVSNGKNTMLSFDKRGEWAELVEKVRLDESKKQGEALRKGLSLIVPEGLLNLLTWRELETLVCGKPILDVDLLRSNTVYRGCSESDAVVEFFWRALTEYTPEERSMYLRFVWGRSRLPLTSKDFPSPHQIEILRTGNRDPDIMLPVAHTCFFSIELPKYSSYEILRDKLKYAITHCQAIDTDGRAYDIWDDDDNF